MASHSTRTIHDEHSATVALNISFRGTPHTITISPASPVLNLHTQLEDLTDVPPTLQKLLFQGKKLVWKSEEDAQSTTIERAGLRDGLKVQLLGSTLKEIEGLKKEEAEHLRKQRVMRERASKAPVKLRSTGSGTTSLPPIQYRFHNVQPLPYLPNSSDALSVLQKLASDPAIKHIMQIHQFKVGLLTELAPHEHPELLGLNQNYGEIIFLRVRTNAYDGFRWYRDLRRVLCHELAHNLFGNHGEQFKALNSQLNREVAEYERSVAQGTHRLDDGDEMYQPELEVETYQHVLGGLTDTDLRSDSIDERRSRILKATMQRLQKQDEEIEDSCGTELVG